LPLDSLYNYSQCIAWWELYNYSQCIAWWEERAKTSGTLLLTIVWANKLLTFTSTRIQHS